MVALSESPKAAWVPTAKVRPPAPSPRAPNLVSFPAAESRHIVAFVLATRFAAGASASAAHLT